MIITLGNFKGGVGKTTSTLLFSYLLSGEHNYKVLGLDLDPQCNFTGGVALTYKKDFDDSKNVYRACFEGKKVQDYIQEVNDNFDILAGSWNMVQFENTANTQRKKKYHQEIISDLLDPVKDNYDFILIDTAPTTNIVLDNAIHATDNVIIPTQTVPLAYESTQKFYEYLRNMNEYTDFGLIGVVPYLTGKSATDERLLNAYKELFGDFVFNHAIKASDKVKTWSEEGITENKGYDKITLSMYNDVVTEALGIIEKEN